MKKRLEDANPVHFLDEHRAIRAAVQGLQTHLRVPDPARRDHWRRQLAEDLEALAGLLRPHFAREEVDGMFDAIVEAEPGSSLECARLRAQHGTLLDTVAAIRQRLQAPGREESLEELRPAVRALIADLARHEAAEDALLIRTMEGDEIRAAD